MSVTIDRLLLGDEPGTWSEAGFRLEGDICVIGDTRVVCTGDGGGADRWSLRPLDDPLPDSLDGIATTASDASMPATVSHPNHVVGLDHVVVHSPDLDRTTGAFEALGVACRRVRDVPGRRAVQQRFFRMGSVIIELVGPPEPAGDGPAGIWGLAVVSEDLDATAQVLGDRLGPAKDAVQPGRRIATLRTRELGISVPVAVMSPHVR